MSQSPIPETVDGRKIFTQQAHIEGSVGLDKLNKFNELLAGREGIVKVVLDFGVDPQLGKIISGKIEAAVQVSCQRCLQPLDIEFADDIRLAVLGSADHETQIKRLEQLDNQLDPWIASDNKIIDLFELVDEQLMLGMPIVYYHDDGKCMHRIGYSAEQAWVESAKMGTNTDSPFAELGKLLAKSKGSKPSESDDN